MEKVKTAVPVDTAALEGLGQTFVHQSLDLLENIGKKTMDVITEKTPEGNTTSNTSTFIKFKVGGNEPEPTLSQILRQRQEEALKAEEASSGAKKAKDLGK